MPRKGKNSTDLGNNGCQWGGFDEKKSLAIPLSFAYTLDMKWGKVVKCATMGKEVPIPALKTIEKGGGRRHGKAAGQVQQQH